MNLHVAAPELAFVAKLEGERDTWRALKAGKDDRVEAIVENNKADYRARNYGTTMPSTVAKEIRHHAEVEEAGKVEQAQQTMLTAQESASEVIQTVRRSTERILPPWRVLDAEQKDDRTVNQQRQTDELAQANAARLLQDAALGPLVERYLHADDRLDWAFVHAVEEAAELGVSKIKDVAREDLPAKLKLMDAIRARKQARWPAWTNEAEQRVNGLLTVSEDALSVCSGCG